MVRFDIIPKKTALLIIDMQQAFLTVGNPREIPRARELIPSLNALISACREKGVLIIFTQHAHRQDGIDLGLYKRFIPSALIDGSPEAEIGKEMDYRKGDLLIKKQAYSSFQGTSLDHILRVNGIDTLVIGGIVLPFCVEATAREARHRNYQVILLSDGVATYEKLPDAGWGAIPAEEVHRVIFTILALRYAEVVPIEQVLGRLSNRN